MSGYRVRRGKACMVALNFALGRIYLSVSVDLLDWRWERPYYDGSFGVWVGPLWIDGWVIQKAAAPRQAGGVMGDRT